MERMFLEGRGTSGIPQYILNHFYLDFLISTSFDREKGEIDFSGMFIKGIRNVLRMYIHYFL